MLTALSLVIGALLLLGLAAVPLAPRAAGARLVHGGCVAACVLLVVLAIWALLAGGGAVLALPFGPPWGRALLALDGLSAWFLLVLGVTGAIASLYAMARPPARPGAVPPYPLFLAGMVLTVAAADAFTLMFGFEVMSLASWALVAADHAQAENRRAARLYLMMAALSAACLVPAFGLLAGHAGGFSFAALRAAPPTGWLAGGVLLLGLLGAGSKAGLAPLHSWQPMVYPAAPSHVTALMSGAMAKVALYVLARLLLDLCGPAQPLWWGVPLLVVGAVSAVLGALRATLEDDTKVLLACSSIENIGLITIGLGLALAFRGADLGPLAALAAGAALLHILNHGVFKTLLFLVAGSVLASAGSRRLDRLGGLIHAMPVTAGCALVGIAAAAALPPLSGFASEWLLLQALLAGWRTGDIGFQVLAAAGTALAAMATALAAAAMVRLFGLVFLGRPRTPRGAGAHEVGRLERWALLIPAGLTLLLGLLPGPMLALAQPALMALLGPAAMAPAQGFALLGGTGEAAAWYLPLALLAALAVAGLLVLLAVRARSPLETRRGPVWNGGFINAPDYLPFGDPLSQPSAGGFAQPLRSMLGTSLLAARQRVDMPRPGETRAAGYTASFADPAFGWLVVPAARLRDAVAKRCETLRDFSVRRCLSLGFGTLLALLALLAWLEAH